MSRRSEGLWKILKEEVYEKFAIFEILKSSRENLSNGAKFDFFLMRGNDFVNVIPYTSEGNIVLVKQYRHGSEDFTIEIPGGVVDPGEDPEGGGRRELEEETGFIADTLEFLGAVHTNPAMQSMRCYCFLAPAVRPSGARRLDPTEDIEVTLMKPSDVFELVRRGEISHSLMLAAFALLFLKHPEMLGVQEPPRRAPGPRA